MTQTFHSDDHVVVVDGPDAGREGVVIDNYKGVYGDDISDGALVRFVDGQPSKDPAADHGGAGHEFSARHLQAK